MMRWLTLCLIAFLSTLQAEVPWGKDACLAFYAPSEGSSSCCKEVNPLAEAGIRCIRFHKEVISPADGPRSHFRPNSSQYTLDAMEKYGFFCGIVRGCDRLMRENPDPWIYETTTDQFGYSIKYDPLK
jgi:putative component of membrane protein insertase Oxa1/YidC/SpoIIIJ protein YidD